MDIYLLSADLCVSNPSNRTFAHENRSAVVAKLLQEKEVAQARRKSRGDDAIDRIPARLGQERTPVSEEEICSAREEACPGRNC